MKTFEIYFDDLDHDAQKALCKEFSTSRDAENWVDIPLVIIDREEQEEQEKPQKPNPTQSNHKQEAYEALLTKKKEELIDINISAEHKRLEINNIIKEKESNKC